MSFPSLESLYALFDNVFFGLPTPIKEFIRPRVLKQFVDYYQGAVPSAEFIASVQAELNEILRHGGIGSFGGDIKEVKMQKAFAKEAVRTCFTLLFYAHMVCTNSSELLNMEDFLIKYPSFRSVDRMERESLLKFRNYTVAFIAFRGAKDNKAKCLFSAGVLSLERHFVYKTGSGQSQATRRRVEIYEREGNITPQPSKKHTVNPKVVVSSDESSVTTTESSLGKRSRSSSTDLDDDISVSSELTADSKRSRSSSLGSFVDLDFAGIQIDRLGMETLEEVPFVGRDFPKDVFYRDEIEINQEMDRDTHVAAVPCLEDHSTLHTTYEEEVNVSLDVKLELDEDFELISFDSEAEDIHVIDSTRG